MQTQQDPAQHLFLSMEVMQICFGEIFAGIAAAIFGQRSKILRIFGLRDLDISLIAECFTMPS
jgi:hypothetical protein